VPRPASEINPGPAPGGVRPLRQHHRRPERPADGSPMYTEGSGRKTGSILAPPLFGSPEEACERRRRTWTHLSTGVGRGVCMLLSFQRPSHLFRKGFLLRGAPGSLTGPGADRRV
jgi:hypothetical protein